MKNSLLFGFAACLIFLSCLMPPAANAVVVRDTASLFDAVYRAAGGGDLFISVADGVYELDDMIWVEADGLTIESLSGDRDSVILKGRGMTGDVSHIFNVAGDNFSVSDITLGEVANHGIQFQPGAQSPVVRNVRFYDTGEQMLKVSYNFNAPEIHSDNGLVENCLFEYTGGIGPQYYIGGVDAHRSEYWVIRGNTFRDIRSPSEAVAEHAVHFWSGAVGTLVENNRIINCDRGIGFGLGDRGHIGGIIRNNMIYHDASEGFADVGIGLESASEARVCYNTIFQLHSYPNAIEYRFEASRDNLITGNLTNRAIVSRDGGAAEVYGNLTSAQSEWFVDVLTGDLHLAYPMPQVIGQGPWFEELLLDYDQDMRPLGSPLDLGADQY